MSLLPSKPDTTAPAEAEPRVVGVDSDDADEVISALSSETARKLLAALHDEPAPPSELADRVDTSLQNAQYHLQKLESAGAVSVVDTAYSAKGREMDVYAPADQPLVIFAGDEEKTTGLRAALSRLLGGLGVVAVGSMIVQTLYGDAAEQNPVTAPAGGAGGNGGGGQGAAGGAAAPGGNGTAAPEATTLSESGYRNDAANASDGNYDPSYTEGAPQETQAEPAGTAAPHPQETPTPETFSTTTDLDGTIDVVNNTTFDAAPPTSTDGVDSTAADTATSTVTDPTTRTVTETINRTAADAANQTVDRAPEAAKATAGIEPGLLFFAAGVVVLALYMGVWYARNR